MAARLPSTEPGVCDREQMEPTVLPDRRAPSQPQLSPASTAGTTAKLRYGFADEIRVPQQSPAFAAGMACKFSMTVWSMGGPTSMEVQSWPNNLVQQEQREERLDQASTEPGLVGQE